jgi:membrane-bound serine protease (ClpP class)
VGFSLAESPPEGKSSPDSPVYLLRIDGTIGPIVANYFGDELNAAAAASAQLVVLELDTPGGLDTSMRQMVRAILASEVPVAVFVAPNGARAASAGVFLLMAAHIAAMAPATNVGAAHPVNMGGEMDEAMAAKVTNDAVAYLQSLAQKRGRNVEWSENVVRESVSIPAEEALELNVIEFIATDLSDLMAQLDGLTVAGETEDRRLATATARLESRRMNWRERFLQRITDPTVAYILLMLGFYGLFFELSNPGSLLPGIVGAICLLVAFLAFQSLPVNYVGVMLILLGLVLLLLEIKVTSYGALSIGGVTALVLGSLLLFDPSHPFGGLSLGVILPAVIFTVCFFLLVIGLGLAAQRRRHFSGLEALAGENGEVIWCEGTAEQARQGKVQVVGEIWEFSSDHPVQLGQVVRIIHRRGRVLVVEPDPDTLLDSPID